MEGRDTGDTPLSFVSGEEIGLGDVAGEWALFKNSLGLRFSLLEVLSPNVLLLMLGDGELSSDEVEPPIFTLLYFLEGLGGGLYGSVDFCSSVE